MIRHAAGIADYAETVSRLAPGDPFACRIRSLYSTYPPSLPFVDYWLTADGRGQANGAIARSGTDYVLLLTAHTDLDEVSSFLEMTGAGRALCDGSYTLTGYRQVNSGWLLQASRPVAVAPSFSVYHPTLRDVYAVLQTCAGEQFPLPPWEDFYVDMNHKLRHGAVRLLGIRDAAELCAVGMTVAETEDSAVLGAVSCRPDRRRQGYGTQVVGSLVNALLREDKTVWLHRAQNDNAAFYQSMGFAERGTWKEYTYNRG